MALEPGTWKELAEAYAFLGNSLLKPMSQTAHVGLDPAFWQAFPDFGSKDVCRALEALAKFAREATTSGDGAAHGDGAATAAFNDAVTQVSVEYTSLFVGPPSPAAPPWETMSRREGVTAGFGEPTFQMRALLRAAGLELAGESRQYEDHLGIETLYLSELCRRRSGDADAPGADDATVVAFLDEHPLAWLETLRAKVAEAFPGGYFDRLLGLLGALLAWHRHALAG